LSLIREVATSLPAVAGGAAAEARRTWWRNAGRRSDEAGSVAEATAAFSTLVQQTARETPLVLAIDDVQDADPSSLETMARSLFVLTSPPSLQTPDQAVAGGLIVLAVRDRVPEALSNAPATTLALHPLDAEGIRRYLAHSEVTARILHATGGVPGRIEALLDAHGAVDLAGRRLERLDPADRGVLATLAVLERPESIGVIREVCADASVLDRLRSLEEGGWISLVPDIGRTHYALARESDRKAILSLLSAETLRSLRLRAAETWLAEGEREAAFRSFRAAGDWERAASTGIALARDLVARGGLDSAESILNSLADMPLDRARRLEILLSLALVLERRDKIRPALAAIGRARSLMPPESRPPLRARAARLCITLGAAKVAERLARGAIASGFNGADAFIAMADARFLAGDYAEAIRLVDSGAALSAADRVALENVRGKALLTLGRLPEARSAFEANARRAETAGLSVEKARALLNVGVVAHRMGLRDDARSAYGAAIAAGELPFTPVVRANLASLHLEDGQVEDALGESHRALSALIASGRIKEQSHAAQNLARIYLFMGDTVRARDIALHAGELAARVGDPYLSALARLVAAESDLASGQSDAAITLPDIAGEFRRLGNRRYHCEALLLLADARLQGNPERTSSALEEARAAGALEIDALVPEWHLLEAERALGAGDEVAAAGSIALARNALARTPHVELPARLYALSARLADHRGDRQAAQADRLRAIRILEKLASRIPADRRSLFFAHPRRRAVFDQAGPDSLLTPAPAVPPAPFADSPAVLVGRAPAIARINQLVERIGPSNATVLIRGQSGTGKELVARALHDRSARRKLPLVAVNCGALSEDLLLSELFGHERGAFTGAVRERKGRFELAAGGTIFLDEIGDISPRAQVALLRVLQERTFERIGGSRTISVDVRLVCATNRPLEELMRRGQFREDLYYRLRGTTLVLPSLRDHLEDLEELCTHCLARLARERGDGAPLRLSREALSLLATHTWPGNVRELFNLLESASLLAVGQTIGPEAFELFPEILRTLTREPDAAEAQLEHALMPRSAESPGGANGLAVDFYQVLRQRDISLRDLRREMDLACIGRALRDSAGNISEAARLLKMKRSRLSQVVNAEPRLLALCRSDVGGPQIAEGEGVSPESDPEERTDE
jgi:transcriptional regulator with GAF, ATPase, and Fis domain